MMKHIGGGSRLDGRLVFQKCARRKNPVKKRGRRMADQNKERFENCVRSKDTLNVGRLLALIHTFTAAFD